VGAGGNDEDWFRGASSILVSWLSNIRLEKWVFLPVYKSIPSKFSLLRYKQDKLALAHKSLAIFSIFPPLRITQPGNERPGNRATDPDGTQAQNDTKDNANSRILRDDNSVARASAQENGTKERNQNRFIA